MGRTLREGAEVLVYAKVVNLSPPNVVEILVTGYDKRIAINPNNIARVLKQPLALLDKVRGHEGDDCWLGTFLGRLEGTCFGIIRLDGTEELKRFPLNQIRHETPEEPQ